jgi:hypothetical protein
MPISHSLEPPSPATDIKPLGVFGRLEYPSGQKFDVSLERAALQKAAVFRVPNQSLNGMLPAARELWRQDHRSTAKPLSLVCVGFGPPLSEETVASWFKREFDEIEHPRWPRGHGDQSGEFKDKDGAANSALPVPEQPSIDSVVEAHIFKDLEKKLTKKAARALIRARLIAGLRILAGVAADAVPLAGEAFDAYEIAQTVADFHDLKILTDIAMDYAKLGPHPLDSLRVSLADEGFSSPEAFVKDFWEKRFGPAGDGYDYHHIVWKGGANGVNIPPELLHSTENMIRMPRLLHEVITDEYRQPYETTGLTLRQWLDKQPYEIQRAKGIEVMRNLGIIK